MVALAPWGVTRLYSSHGPHHLLREIVVVLGPTSKRNRLTCQMCGAGPGDVVLSKRVRLEVDHIDPKLAGGSEELTNLRVLCDVCNGASVNASPSTFRPGRAAMVL